MDITIKEILESLHKVGRPGDFSYQLFQSLDNEAVDKTIITKLCEIQDKRKEFGRKREIELALINIFNHFYDSGHIERAHRLENIILSSPKWEANNLFFFAVNNIRGKQFQKAIYYFESLFRKDNRNRQDKEIARLFGQCVLESQDVKLLAKAYYFLLSFIGWDIDYVTILNLSRIVKNILSKWTPPNLIPIKIAILGGFTTKQIPPILELFCLKHNINPEVYEANYNQYEQEIIDAQSQLYRFKPDIVIIAITHRVLKEYPNSTDSLEDIQKKSNSVINRLKNLWDICRKNMPCTIIQHNFDIPPENFLGHIAGRLSWSQGNFLKHINHLLDVSMDDGVVILDLDKISSDFGRERWTNNKYWFFSKQAFDLQAIPLLCHHYVALIRAIKGLTKKCLVLDLDNTLWGGVIGDDGIENIYIGGDPEGEAYQDFQEYIKQLNERGVILCVVSKNNEDVAKAPFLNRPEMILHLDDFAVFMADWGDKATNIRKVSEILNLSLDSFVFIDDNPVEREIIRQTYPEVSVLELSEDPAEYKRYLDKELYFESITYSKEDEKRTDYYKENAQRYMLKEQVTDLDSFYKSLQMVARIGSFSDMKIPRITQLVNKTNQFNLTTKRYNEVQIKEFMNNPGAGAFYLELSDRFGDNGLVSVMICHLHGEEIIIDTWLMSCRVFGRTVENVFLNHIVEWAKKNKAKRIKGEYISTKKNGYVKDLYDKMGFKKGKELPSGESFWEVDVGQLKIANTHYITVEEAEGA